MTNWILASSSRLEHSSGRLETGGLLSDTSFLSVWPLLRRRYELPVRNDSEMDSELCFHVRCKLTFFCLLLESTVLVVVLGKEKLCLSFSIFSDMRSLTSNKWPTWSNFQKGLFVQGSFNNVLCFFVWDSPGNYALEIRWLWIQWKKVTGRAVFPSLTRRPLAMLPANPGLDAF